MDEDIVWPLEYARLSSVNENSMFVLNGSLVGYIATKGINELIRSKKLALYLTKAEHAYKRKNFHYSDENWTYYMLNKKTVIPIHYLIFEQKLFEAAYELNNDVYFFEEYQYRKKLLSKALRVEFYKEADGGISYYMMRNSTPNEYQIDTYATKIEFLNSEGKVVDENINLISGSLDENSFYKGMFANGCIYNNDISSYKVYSNSGGGWYLLFENKIEISKICNIYRNDLEYTAYAKKDALLKNDEIKLVSKLSDYKEGNYVIDLNCPDEKGKYIYAIEANNISKYEITLGLLIYDENNVGAGRYYTTLLPGKNLILFDSNGFVDSDAMKNVSSIWLRMYEGDYDTACIKINGCYHFLDYKTIYEYIKSCDFKIHPQ